MKIENVTVCGLEPAMRDMRNPLESWAQSDSTFYSNSMGVSQFFDTPVGLGLAPECPSIGERDLALACKLVKAGGSHRKFMREIVVWWTITLPRSVWQELDTYKVSTVRNSCSTMHKLGHRDLTTDDFEGGVVMPEVLEALNVAGRCYRNKTVCVTPFGEFEGVSLLRHMKAILPEGFLQKAGYVFNYEVALRMYHDRKSHKMTEWSGEGGICHVIKLLPYMKDFLEAAGEC